MYRVELKTGRHTPPIVSVLRGGALMLTWTTPDISSVHVHACTCISSVHVDGACIVDVVVVLYVSPFKLCICICAISLSYSCIIVVMHVHKFHREQIYKYYCY